MARYEQYISTVYEVDGQRPPPLEYQFGDPGWLGPVVMVSLTAHLSAALAAYQVMERGAEPTVAETVEWQNDALLAEMQAAASS